MEGILARELEAAVLSAIKVRGASMANKSDIIQFDGWTEAWTKQSLLVSNLKELLDWVYEDDH